MAAADRQTRRVWAGALIIAGIVALAVLVFLLEDIRDAFARTYRLVALFPEAPDLVVDAPVWLAGKPVGRVTHVGLLPAGYDTLPIVAVEMKLPRRLQAQVREDSYARLASTAMIGERVVDIIPGSPQRPAMQPGDTMEVQVPRYFAVLMERAADVSAEVDSLLATIDRIRVPLAQRMAALAPARREIALARIEAAELSRVIRTGPAGRAIGDAELRAAVTRVGRQIAGIGPALQRAAGTTEGAGRETRAAVDSLRLRIATLQAEIAAFETELETGDGFIPRLAADSAIPVAVNATRAELDSLVADVRRNPFRFFRLRLW